MDQLSFEIRELDDEFNGGLKIPSITSFKTNPDSKVQKLYSNILDEKNVMYYSFVNSEEQVQHIFDETEIDAENISIKQINGFKDITGNDLSTETDLIFIESFEVLEDIQNEYADRYKYLDEIFTGLYKLATEYNLAILLDISKHSTTEDSHDYTYRACDNILELEYEYSGKNIDTYLTILKSRLQKTETKRLKLDVDGYDIKVDTKRGIS